MTWFVRWFPNIEIQMLIALLAIPCFVLLRAEKSMSSILLKSTISFFSCLFLSDLILVLLLSSSFVDRYKVNILGCFLWQVFGADVLSCVYRFIGGLKKINLQSFDDAMLIKLINIIKKLIKK